MALTHCSVTLHAEWDLITVTDFNCNFNELFTSCTSVVAFEILFIFCEYSPFVGGAKGSHNCSWVRSKKLVDEQW